MEQARRDGRRQLILAARVGLAAFVLAWIFDPFGLRAAVPVWLPFAIALALEAHFFLAREAVPTRDVRADRLPQAVDRERYGYASDARDLLLVREGGTELWIPHAGETGDELDALIAAARERAAQPPDVRSSDPRPPAERGRLRRFLAGVTVVAALAALVWFVERRAGWAGVDAEDRAAATQRFSVEASEIVGRPVVIRCDDAGEHVGAVQHADGVATIGGRLAYLTPERCHDLYRLAFEDDVRFSQTARALAVLAHEAWHLRGVRDEGVTECYALQSGVALGRRLGLSEDTARRMMRHELAENALRARTSPAYVVPQACRDGGELDLDPASGEFP